MVCNMLLFTGRPREILQGGTRLPRLLSKLKNYGQSSYNVNVNDDRQPEFRSLSEFYIIIFSEQTKNSWKYLNKIEKNLNKTSMAKAMAASEIHRPCLGIPGPRSMYRLKPPLIGPGCI